MLPRLACPGVANVFALLRLLPVSNQDKDAEILALRHQITVPERWLSRDRVRFAPSDRAFPAAPLHRLPRRVLRRARLPVRPDTALHRHRALVSRRHTARSRPGLPAQSKASYWSCVYCFARKTHSYLDLDTGLGFDSQIVVKVNAPELLRRGLAAPSWRGEHIAMGTNVDCYQRAEGRYALMPGIIAALRDRANPFSILTKGTLILRDLDLLRQAAAVTDVGISVSVGFMDEQLWRTVEPGTPAPARRLEVVRTLSGHGIECGVLMAPVIPFLGDHPDQLRATVRAIAAAGATSVTPLVLHLRPGAREWFMTWLASHHPHLVRRYERLYADGAYAPKWYQRRITRHVHELAREFGIGPSRAGAARRIPEPQETPPAPTATQLTLL